MYCLQYFMDIGKNNYTMYIIYLMQWSIWKENHNYLVVF